MDQDKQPNGGDQQGPPVEAKAAPKSKKVKIKLQRDCLIEGNIQKAGSVLMVSEDDAKEFCDRHFDGYIPAYGTLPEMLREPGQPGPLDRQKITRAVRVA